MENKRITLDLSKEIMKKIEKIKKNFSCSQSQAIRIALKEYKLKGEK